MGDNIMNKTISFEDLKHKCYPSEKRALDLQVSFWVYYFIRPISFYFTYIAFFLRVLPNQATLIGFIIGLFSILFAYQSNFLYTALALNLFAVLDCVDGNLARLGIPSKRGEYYDAVSGDIVNYLFPLVFFLSILRDGQFHYLEFIGTSFTIIIIFLVTFISLLTALVNQRLKVLMGPLPQDEVKSMPQSLLVERVVRNLYGAAFLYPMTLIAATLNHYDIFLFYLALSSPIFYIYSLTRINNYGDNK